MASSDRGMALGRCGPIVIANAKTVRGEPGMPIGTIGGLVGKLDVFRQLLPRARAALDSVRVAFLVDAL